MRESIFVVNAGSSSIKFSVLETLLDPSLRTGAHGQVEGIGASPRLEVADASGRKLADSPVVCGDHEGAIKAINGFQHISTAKRGSTASATALSMVV